MCVAYARIGLMSMTIAVATHHKYHKQTRASGYRSSDAQLIVRVSTVHIHCDVSICTANNHIYQVIVSTVD